MFEGLGASNQFPGPLKPLQYFEFIVLAQVVGPLFRVLEKLLDSFCLGPGFDYLEQIFPALI